MKKIILILSVLISLTSFSQEKPVPKDCSTYLPKSDSPRVAPEMDYCNPKEVTAYTRCVCDNKKDYERWLNEVNNNERFVVEERKKINEEIEDISKRVKEIDERRSELNDDNFESMSNYLKGLYALQIDRLKDISLDNFVYNYPQFQSSKSATLSSIQNKIEYIEGLINYIDELRPKRTAIIVGTQNNSGLTVTREKESNGDDEVVSEEKKKQEAEKRAKESVSAYNAYLDDIKSLKDLRSNGLQNTQLYKSFQERISLYEYSHDIPIEKREGTNFESKKNNRIYSGVDGNKSDTNAYNIQQETKENVAKVHKQSEIIGNELHGLANNITSSIFANQERKREQERLERERKEREYEEKKREEKRKETEFKTNSIELNNLHKNMSEEEKENEINSYKEVLKNPTKQTCFKYLKSNYKLYRNNVNLINDLIDLNNIELDLRVEKVRDLNYQVEGIQIVKSKYGNKCILNIEYYYRYSNLFKNVVKLDIGVNRYSWEHKPVNYLRTFLRKEDFPSLKSIRIIDQFGYDCLIDSNFNEIDLDYLKIWFLPKDENIKKLDLTLFKAKEIEVGWYFNKMYDDEIFKINLDKLEDFEKLRLNFVSKKRTKREVKEKINEIMNSLTTLNNCKYKLDIDKYKSSYSVVITKKK